MASYEQMTIIGNVGRDPEVKYLQSGVAVTSFSVGVTKKWTTESGERSEKTKWFRVTAWRKLAEICGEHVRKGMLVQVVGEIDANAYKDKEGSPAASLELTAREVTFLSRTNESESQREEHPF